MDHMVHKRKKKDNQKKKEKLQGSIVIELKGVNRITTKERDQSRDRAGPPSCHLWYQYEQSFHVVYII